MRIILIFITVVVYLFVLVYIESQLVKIEFRKENLKNRIVELRNEEKILEFEAMDISNLANIEQIAKNKGFIFPEEKDILGVIK